MIKWNLVRFLFFRIFIMNECVEFSLILSGTEKQDWSKSKEILSFLPK